MATSGYCILDAHATILRRASPSLRTHGHCHLGKESWQHNASMGSPLSAMPCSGSSQRSRLRTRNRRSACLARLQTGFSRWWGFSSMPKLQGNVSLPAPPTGLLGKLSQDCMAAENSSMQFNRRLCPASKSRDGAVDPPGCWPFSSVICVCFQVPIARAKRKRGLPR